VPTRDERQVLTDGDVMELVAAGRRDEALAGIVQALRRKVFGLAYSFLRNREAAEDVAQEVFIRVWRALPGYDRRASVSTWVYSITRNASLSALRARRSRGGAGSAADSDAVESTDIADESAFPEREAEDASLRRLIGQLPERQRQVVVLFYLQEQSHEEVAAMLAMPVGTVKTLLHRARARLAEAAGGAP
jgi:RNA polymerase sigma-70 factor (ECF subfamily)